MSYQSEGKPIRWFERVGLVAFGHSLKQLEEVLFDYALYPLVIYLLGVIWGGIVMTFLSALSCLIYLKLYDYFKLDLFGFETIKEFKESESKDSRAARLVQWIARKGDIPAFFALSAWFDPFMTVTYLRRGQNEFNGMSRRDWGIFFASVVVSNLAWISVVGGAVEITRPLIDTTLLWLWSFLF